MFSIFSHKVRTALCATLALLVGVTAAQADVSVTGTGMVTLRPDIAFLSLSVVTEAHGAADAMDQNSQAMRRLFKLLEQFGIGEKDVQTVHYSLQPKYRYPASSEPVLIGYVVTNALQIKVRNLPDTGKIVDGVVKEGANRITGINFAISDMEKALDEARAKAMADALRKAESCAQGGKVTLGPVKSISENFTDPQTRWHYEIIPALNKDGVPFAPGENDLSVSVHVVFTLGQGK